MIRIATPKPTPDFLFAYSGRELDGDLQFNHARHYDPTVGRFISEEPAAYVGDADLHRYAGNRPADTGVRPALFLQQDFAPGLPLFAGRTILGVATGVATGTQLESATTMTGETA